MDQSPCKLTLVYPLAAENRIVELMLGTTPPVGGFTTMHAEGHGHDFGNASLAERVRGRVGRGLLTCVIAKVRADQLLSELEVKAPLHHLVYWLEPVLAFGRMAPASTETPGFSGDSTDGRPQTIQLAANET